MPMTATTATIGRLRVVRRSRSMGAKNPDAQKAKYPQPTTPINGTPNKPGRYQRQRSKFTDTGSISMASVNTMHPASKDVNLLSGDSNRSDRTVAEWTIAGQDHDDDQGHIDNKDMPGRTVGIEPIERDAALFSDPGGCRTTYKF